MKNAELDAYHAVCVAIAHDVIVRNPTGTKPSLRDRLARTFIAAFPEAVEGFTLDPRKAPAWLRPYLCDPSYQQAKRKASKEW